MRQAKEYEVVHYPSKPFRYTRPDCIELIARLHGLDPAPSTRARVLEIGCGTGGNLLPMAEVFPNSRFVGVDLSESQIAYGETLRAEAGLDNVELKTQDLGTLDDSYGQFDYVIAHGVYSWVPAPVKARLLDVLAERLAPGGIAYLSYNVKPGWYTKAPIRDIMQYHTRGYDDPLEKVRQGRQILDFIASGTRETDVAWRTILKQQIETANRIPPEVVLYDHLSETSDACYFHEIAAELPGRGLMYLGDASFSSMLPNRIAPEAIRVIDQLGDDVIQREQYLDYIKNRQFRTSLFVKAGSPVSRRIELRTLFDWHVCSKARYKGPRPDLGGPTPMVLEVSNAVAQVVPPYTKRAMAQLIDRQPASRVFSDLVKEAGEDGAQLAVELFQLYSFDILQLWLYPDPFTFEPGERPTATRISRAVAARGTHAPNLRHETVPLEPVEQRLLALLDGTRDRAALAAALPGVDVDATLDALARKALFVRG